MQWYQYIQVGLRALGSGSSADSAVLWVRTKSDSYAIGVALLRFGDVTAQAQVLSRSWE